MAFTIPLESTDTTLSFTGVNISFPALLPLGRVALRAVFSPFLRVIEVLFRVSSLGSCFTYTVHDAVLPLGVVAVMTALPDLLPVILPVVGSTETVLGSLDTYLMPYFDAPASTLQITFEY